METLHAACVTLGGAGILIRGSSGSGKSSLALLLAAGEGGAFVADDRVVCTLGHGHVVARPHAALAGRVEVRGQGILSVSDLGVPLAPEATLGLVVDLVAAAPRLPEPPQDAEILSVRLPCLILDGSVRAAGLAPLLVRAALRNRRP
jgi:serine kinase of HPr protein (carbohydrate metabolism regulator)